MYKVNRAIFLYSSAVFSMQYFVEKNSTLFHVYTYVLIVVESFTHCIYTIGQHGFVPDLHS